MREHLAEAYKYAVQALQESTQCDSDPDAIFRLTHRVENLACLLALVTGNAQELRKRFPQLEPALCELVDRWKEQPGGWVFEEYMRPSPVFASLGLSGDFQTRADAVSADGSTICGSGVIREDAHLPVFAFRWTAREGKVNLGTLGGFLSAGEALSADGSVLVGHSQNEGRIAEAFYWTQAEGMQGLGPGGGLRSKAYNVAASGPLTVAVGLSAGDSDDTVVRAVQWIREGKGSFEKVDLGTLGGRFGAARGVSADGRVIVGDSEDAEGTLETFRWTESEGMVGLGHFVDKRTVPCHSVAYEVSADGSVIIGQGTGPARSHQAFRWTPKDGLVPLEMAAGSPNCRISAPRGVSCDGRLIVGKLTDHGGPLDSRAFIWDQEHGIRSLQTVLEAGGVSLNGWKLMAATHISDSGKVVVGYGLNPDGHTEGWRVDLSSLDAVPSPWAASWADTQFSIQELLDTQNTAALAKGLQNLMNKAVWNSA